MPFMPFSMMKTRWQFRIRRGKSTEIKPEKTVLQPGEWCWLIDKQSLVTGDGVTPGWIEGKYQGGLLTFFIQWPVGFSGRQEMPLPCLPPTVPYDVLKELVLDSGEVIYCPEHDWLYVGDGATKGGVKAR